MYGNWQEFKANLAIFLLCFFCVNWAPGIVAIRLLDVVMCLFVEVSRIQCGQQCCSSWLKMIIVFLVNYDCCKCII